MLKSADLKMLKSAGLKMLKSADLKSLKSPDIELVQTLPQPRQLREVQAPWSYFWKKLLLPRNTKASKKRNGLIMFPW